MSIEYMLIFHSFDVTFVIRDERKSIAADYGELIDMYQLWLSLCMWLC